MQRHSRVKLADRLRDATRTVRDPHVLHLGQGLHTVAVPGTRLTARGSGRPLTATAISSMTRSNSCLIVDSQKRRVRPGNAGPQERRVTMTS